MVELRKRKAPAEPPPPPPPKRKSSKSSTAKTVVEKAKAAVTGKASSSKAAAPATVPATDAPPTVGSTISLDDFGAEIETSDGEKTSLKTLVEASKAGVVLFTYPKASTPGCKSLPFYSMSSWFSSSIIHVMSRVVVFSSQCIIAFSY